MGGKEAKNHCRLDSLHQEQESSSTFCSQSSSCPLSFCEDFHSKTHQQDKGRRHFLHRGHQHLCNTEDCSWEMTCSYLTKSFWALPESTSSAKANWRGKRTTPAEEKGYCLRANLEVTLYLTSCQESTRQVRTGGFPGGQRTLFAVQEASSSSSCQSRVPAPQTLTRTKTGFPRWKCYSLGRRGPCLEVDMSQL